MPNYCVGMLTFRSVDLQTATLHSDLERGLYDPAEVAGNDWLIPLAEGLEVRARIKRYRELEIRTHVEGIGSTDAERTASWAAATEALMAVMDHSLAPGDLVAIGPYLGLDEGETATVSARCINAVAGPILRHMSYQRWSFVLRAVDGVDWQFEGS